MPAWSRAGHPQRGLAGHALVADQGILDRGRDGVAQVQRAGDVGRRHGDHKGLFRGVDARLEIALRPPPVVQRALDGLRIIGLRHLLRQRRWFVAHAAFLSWSADNKKTLSSGEIGVSRRRKGSAFRGTTPICRPQGRHTRTAVTGGSRARSPSPTPRRPSQAFAVGALSRRHPFSVSPLLATLPDQSPYILCYRY